MKIEIESTTKIVHVNGVPARIWEGETENGVRVCCFITRLRARADQDTSQFDRELRTHRAPSPEAETIPLRMIL